MLAALGPRMLELAAERSAGALTYNSAPEATAWARSILGAGPLLAVEQAVLVEDDPAEARRIAREYLAFYLTLPNYVRAWERAGFGPEERADGSSDRLVDAMVAWGSPDVIAEGATQQRRVRREGRGRRRASCPAFHQPDGEENLMKAIVQDRFGAPDVLELREIPEPQVGEDEVLVRVHAASVNPADWYAMTGTPYVARPAMGLRKPKTRLGIDLAGVVVAVGGNVTRFTTGDEVFGAGSGTLAESVAVPEEGLALKPSKLSFEQAAAVPVAGLTALQGLRDKGRIRPGQRVMINGASGGVGTFAVQLAKSFGAEVTGVCSTRNLAMVGAPKGSRLLGPLGHVGTVRLASLRASQRVVFFISKSTLQDLEVLQELLEAGTVTPVVERSYALGEAADALRYLGEGHAQGKLVIAV